MNFSPFPRLREEEGGESHRPPCRLPLPARNRVWEGRRGGRNAVFSVRDRKRLRAKREREREKSWKGEGFSFSLETAQSTVSARSTRKDGSFGDARLDAPIVSRMIDGIGSANNERERDM